ncbi:MAG: hypothetical protein JOZ81_09140 [Chloroflexi bacterium]|nr:hypothetical protein [Chloroflexota bacterium]MBV9543075.1 hypothetical protein [Chloroflexota bacterium]
MTNTPANEAPELATAITDFAYFRGAIALLASGNEDEARAQLDALQTRDASSPLSRVGAQMWDQYGMTAQLRGACAQVQPQITTQAAQTFATLSAAGVSVDPATVCSVPGA